LGRRPMPTTGPIYNLLADRYEGALRACLRFPRWAVFGSLLVAIPGLWLAGHLESGFMPEMDEGAFVLDYKMPVGTSLAETDKVLRRVEAVLSRTEDISGYIRRTGAELGFFATESYTGDILVSLKPPGQRRAMSEIVSELEEALKGEIPELEEIEFVPLIQDQISDLAGVSKPIEVKVFGPDVAVLRDLAEKVAGMVEEAGGKDVNANVRLGNPDIVVRPDSVQTARVGLTEMDIENQLNAALYGQVASTVPEEDRMTKIRVRYPDRVRFNTDELGQLPINLPLVTSTSGRAAGPSFVPLSQLASITYSRSPNEFFRENQQPVITVEGALEGQDLGAVNREIQTQVAKLAFPPGYRWELAGDYRAQQDSFANLLMVLLVASALVFLLLGFQFHSLTLPLLIFLTQPISLTSALVALWITGTPLNVSSFMGAILLIGLDVKNGIILIEYIGQLRSGGMPLDQALVTAGRVRFRPILMTSLCTIFGLVPLALGLGPGAQMQQPLAIAVIGGLITNTLLTRLLIPVGYLALRGRGQAAPH
jgi:multidrug efflux pump subunit AcrB